MKIQSLLRSILTIGSIAGLAGSALADGHKNIHFYRASGTIRWDLLTHLVYIDSTHVDENGAFVPHTQSEINIITTLRDEARRQNKVFMLSYGDGFEHVKPMLEDNSKRAAYVTSMAAVISQYELDGIDIDFEYPFTTYERDLQDTFHDELRVALGEKPLFSADIAIGFQLTANSVNNSLDWIQTMNYQYRTAAQSATDLSIWTNNGVAKSKINLGVPFSGKSPSATVPWDICYTSFVDTISPFDPAVNSIYYPRYEGTFSFVGVDLQKEKVRVAAEGGNGTMVWHHACDVDDPDKSLAVSLHDEIVRHTSVIDSFELPIGSSSAALYQSGSADIEGSHIRAGGFTGGLVTLSIAGHQWSNDTITSKPNPKSFAFPSGSTIRFDFKPIETHTDISFYLRLFDSSGDYIQSPYYNAFGSTDWKRAEYSRSSFNTNANFDENDVRSYQILAQYGSAAIPAFTAHVVIDNMVMVSPSPSHRPVEDRDADGYSDRLETTLGSLTIDSSSTPGETYHQLHTWWKFDNNFSLLAREENQQVHGKIYGASWTTGKSGSALELDGVDDRIIADNTAALIGSNPFTISAWVKTSDADGGMIIQQRDGTSTDGQYRLSCDANGKVNFSIHNSGYQFNFPSSTTINDGSWHHITAVRDGSNGYLYIDGTLDAQATGPLKALSSHEIAIGYDHRDNNFHLAGSIDDVRVYCKALNATTINAIAIPFLDIDDDDLEDNWEVAQFGNTTTNNDPQIDLDGDGMSLFKEMVFGGNALTLDKPTDVSSLGFNDDNGAHKMQFTYRRLKDYSALGLTYQPQTSSSLLSNDWSDEYGSPVSITPDADGISEWVMIELPLASGNPREFFRCRVTIN